MTWASWGGRSVSRWSSVACPRVSWMGRATLRCAGVIQTGAALLRMARARARTVGTDAREQAGAGRAAEERKRGALAAQ
eukprot:3533306-Prymnesium_polylepis.1